MIFNIKASVISFPSQLCGQRWWLMKCHSKLPWVQSCPFTFYDAAFPPGHGILHSCRININNLGVVNTRTHRTYTVIGLYWNGQLVCTPASRRLIACPGRTDGLCPSQVERSHNAVRNSGSIASGDVSN